MVGRTVAVRWLLVLVALLTVACGGSDSVDDDQTDATATSAAPAGHEHGGMMASPVPSNGDEMMQVFLVASELVVGENRFAVGLTMPDNAIIDDAEVTFTYFDLSNPAAPAEESSSPATRLASLDGDVVIYAHERAFDRAGDWGVAIEAVRPDGTILERNISFQVLTDSPSLAIGEAAPASDSPTAADVDGDLTQLTSADEPNSAFYELSIADALANDKPTVVLFATPAYCATRFCGPDYEITSGIQQRLGDQVNMIHVEIYSGLPDPASNGWQLNQSMLDFGLKTEPWLYVIDADGTVAWRVEGLFTEQEVLGALANVGVS